MLGGYQIHRDRPPVVLRAVLKRLITMELDKTKDPILVYNPDHSKKIEPQAALMVTLAVIQQKIGWKFSQGSNRVKIGSRVEIPNTQRGFTLHLISTLWPLWAQWMILRFNHLFGNLVVFLASSGFIQFWVVVDEPQLS